MLYGKPFPGVFVADEAGGGVAKFFHDSYKQRDSPELLIDAAPRSVKHAEPGVLRVAAGCEFRVFLRYPSRIRRNYRG